MQSSLLYLAILASHVSALAFKGPQATSQAEVGDLVFPPEPTTAPKVHADLFRRQNVMTDLLAPDNTCGFISGLAGAAYYCNPSTDICAFFPGTSTTYGFIGCCNPANFNCGARVTCVNSRQYFYSSVCDNGCEKNTFTLKCTAASAPYCNGIRFPVEGVEDYFCDNTLVSTWQTAYTTYSFENDGRAFSPLTVTLTSAVPTSGTTGIPLVGVSSTTPSPPSKSSSSAGSGSQSSTGPQSSLNGGSSTSTGAIGGQTINPTPIPVPSPSSGTPIGAIVGGAVGGVAGLAIIAVVVFLILRHFKKKDTAPAIDNTGLPPPTYMPPQDTNNTAYAAANAGKPAPTVQDTPLAGQWAPVQNQYPPQMQEQQQYPPQMQEQQQYPSQQQQYPPQQPQYAPPPQDQHYQQQQFPAQMQQETYPSMAEVQGSYGQTLQQNPNSANYPQNQNVNPHYSIVSNVTQPSPIPQAHLSATYPDRGETTSPVSAHQASELGTPGGAHGPQSPAPTFVSNVGPPPSTRVAPEVDGRAEMSANMAGGSFPVNAYEVPGSNEYHR